MFNAPRAARIARIVATIGTAAVAVLLLMAKLGIWMEGFNLHPTPRVNAFTIGMGLVPLPALAWVVYLWTRKRPTRAVDFAVRTALSGILLFSAYFCVSLALFAAFFVG